MNRFGRLRGWGLRFVALALGGALVAGVVRHVGAAALWAELSRAFVILPALALCEGLRIPLEARVTAKLLEARGKTAAVASLLRAHVIFYGLSIAAPGGRPVAELAKAAMLRAALGAPRAAALSTSSQATSFVADAVVTLGAALCVFAVAGPSPLTLVLALFALAAAALSGLVVFASSGSLSTWLARFPRLRERTARFEEAAREVPLIQPSALVSLLAARGCQLAFFAVSFTALGGRFELGPVAGMLALSMLASAVGDAVPGQIGVTDAMFSLGAAPLGLTAAAVVSHAMLFHLVQIGWVVVSAAAGALRPVPSLECFDAVQDSTTKVAKMESR